MHARNYMASCNIIRLSFTRKVDNSNNFKANMKLTKPEFGGPKSLAPIFYIK